MISPRMNALPALLVWLLALIFGPAMDGQVPESVIDVITEDKHTGELSCYAIGENGRVRETDPFEPDEMVMLVSDYDCFESYIGERDGAWKVLNRLESGKLYDPAGKEIDKTPVHERILSLAAELEHSIMQIRIYEVRGHFFACADFNVNWHWPFKLYYYDRKLDSLVHVATFESESPVGFRLGERFL